MIIAFWLAIIAVSLGTKLLPFDTLDFLNIGVFPILFLHGPLLFLYVSSLTNEKFILKWSVALHTIPFFVIEIYRSFGHSVSVNSSSNLTENPHYIYNNIYFTLLVVSLIIYWVLSLNLIFQHRKDIPFNFSNYTGRNTLNWLIFMMLLFLIFFVTDTFISNIEKLTNRTFIEISNLHINLTIFTFILVFFGNKQSAIYKIKRGDNKNLVGISEAKYKSTAVKEQQVEEIKNMVFSYLKNKKPYLNSEYCFQMMVDDLDISRHKLSHVINSSQKKNFYKLINEFRVEEVKEMLINPAYKNFTILGIAFECGFNLKSTFNRIFKEETGFTPSDYKKSL